MRQNKHVAWWSAVLQHLGQCTIEIVFPRFLIQTKSGYARDLGMLGIWKYQGSGNTKDICIFLAGTCGVLQHLGVGSKSS